MDNELVNDQKHFWEFVEAFLAKEKLGATDESSVKTLVMEKTGLAFINVNLEIILERLKAL